MCRLARTLLDRVQKKVEDGGGGEGSTPRGGRGKRKEKNEKHTFFLGTQTRGQEKNTASNIKKETWKRQGKRVAVRGF